MIGFWMHHRFQAPVRKVTTFGSHKCKVFLMSSPLASCNRPRNLSGGVTGAYLRFERITKVGPNQWALFAAGYFEFGPAKTTLFHICREVSRFGYMQLRSL